MITGPRATVKLARKLRSEMTLPETLLWRELRKRPGNFKFRRQHPAGPYVLDFYCAGVRLALEIDGFAHDNARAATADDNRAAYLRSRNVATMRIPAKAVLEDLAGVVVRIETVCAQRAEKLARLRTTPLHHPSDGPPPRAGEDRR